MLFRSRCKAVTSQSMTGSSPVVDVGSAGLDLGAAVVFDGDGDRDNAAVASFWMLIKRQCGQLQGLAGLGGVYSRCGLTIFMGLGRASVSAMAACLTCSNRKRHACWWRSYHSKYSRPTIAAIKLTRPKIGTRTYPSFIRPICWRLVTMSSRGQNGNCQLLVVDRPLHLAGEIGVGHQWKGIVHRIGSSNLH